VIAAPRVAWFREHSSSFWNRSSKLLFKLGQQTRSGEISKFSVFATLLHHSNEAQYLIDFKAGKTFGEGQATISNCRTG